VRAHGGSPSTRAQVEAIYMDASIGELPAADIWRRVGHSHRWVPTLGQLPHLLQSA